MNLNRIHDAFENIRAEESLKRRTKQAMHETITRSQKRRKRIAAYAAAAVLIFTCFGGYRLYYTPVCAMSVDINPSLEFSINRFDRVIDVTGQNADGTALAQSANVKNMHYTEALSAIFATDTVRAYAENGTEVVVAVLGNDGKKTEQMLAAAQNCKTGNMHMYCYASNEADAEAARQNGLSLGKYGAYLELKKTDPDITIDDIRNKNMREIRDMIDQSAGTQSGGGNGGQHRQQNRGSCADE